MENKLKLIYLEDSMTEMNRPFITASNESTIYVQELQFRKKLKEKYCIDFQTREALLVDLKISYYFTLFKNGYDYDEMIDLIDEKKLLKETILFDQLRLEACIISAAYEDFHKKVNLKRVKN